MFYYNIDQDIQLKLLSSRDAKAIFDTIDENRTYLREYLPFVDNTKDEKDVKQFIKSSREQFMREEGFQAGIWFKGEFAGIIGINKLNKEHKSAAIGYWLAEKFQGKGIITQSCGEIVGYLFSTLDLTRIEIQCAEDNFKSREIPKRLGFIEEGYLRQNENVNGIMLNHYLYSMLKDEWNYH